MEQLKRRFEVAQWMAEDFAGVISDEKKALLEEWKRESVANEEEYRELLQEFQKGEAMPLLAEKQKIQQQWKRFVEGRFRNRLGFRRWMAYAAVFMLLLGFGGIVYWQSFLPVEQYEPTEVQVAEGKVVLILSDGAQVELEQDVDELLSDRLQTRVQVTGRTIQYMQDEELQGEEVYNTLVIPKGGEYRIVLADGSRVWLNSESEFRYPVHFGANERRVYLKGEACFEVAKQTEKPFIVSTSGGVDVRVLGTCFNVASYDDDENVVTTLAQGRVEVCLGNRFVPICPDEQLVFHKTSGSFAKKQVDAAIYLAWRDGKFIFENQTLEQIMKQLQRWYQVEVVYADEAARNKRFSGDLKKYDDFAKIMEMLKEVSGIQIQIKNHSVVVGTR